MTRNRYKIFETDYPYLITCTVVNWLPLLKTEFTKRIIIPLATRLCSVTNNRYIPEQSPGTRLKTPQKRTCNLATMLCGVASEPSQRRAQRRDG